MKESDVKYIVVHCAATREGQDIDIKRIDKMHKARGFRKVGYHFFIKLDGIIQKGRYLSEPGAHVRGYNSKSIGICYCGGLDSNGKPKDTRTEDQKESLESLILAMRERFPSAIVCSHYDFSEDKNNNGKIDRWEKMKACPCFDAKEEYKRL